MRLVVMMMLGVCLQVSSNAQDGAVSPGASRPPAPARATGELTDAEKRFQGLWRLHAFGSDKDTGRLRIDERAFRADGDNGWYEGYVSIRPDTSPAQIDFTIEQCACKFEGMTSTGIYYEDGGDIVFAGPAPGDPRPETFAGLDYLLRMRSLDPTTGGDAPR